MKKLVISTAIAFMMAAPAHADIALSLTDLSGPFAMPFADTSNGWEFTVNTAITLTHLGFFDSDLDGLAFDHPIGLYRVSDGALLTSGTMSAGEVDPLTGNFRYIDVADVELSTDENYVLAVYSVQDLWPPDYWMMRLTDEVWAPEINYLGSLWSEPGAGGLILPPNEASGMNPDRIGPNFKFIPAPGAICLFALAGLAARRRRRR